MHPPKRHGQSYVNMKNCHSIILQAVCHPDMKCSHVYSGWQGSVNNSRVPKDSHNNHIFGDGEYSIKNGY